MWDLIVSVPDHCLSFYFPNVGSLYFSLFIVIFVVLEAEIMQNRQGKYLNLPLIYVIEVKFKHCLVH